MEVVLKKRKIAVFSLLFILITSVFSQINSFGPIENESRETKRNHGILFNTIINDDNVNIRSIPSLKGEKVGKLQKSAIVKIVGISSTRNIDRWKAIGLISVKWNRINWMGF